MYFVRYVREWLGCMASANIVNFDPKEGKFWLPSHRANIMELKGLVMTLPVLYGGFFKVAECFRKDGPAGVQILRVLEIPGEVAPFPQGMGKDRP